MAETVWSRWTMVDPKATSPTPQRESQAPLTDGIIDPPTPEWVLRPAWQRAGLATASLAVGAGVVGMFYFARRRIIRQVSLRKDGRTFLAVFESAGNYTHVHPKSACKLLKGRGASKPSSDPHTHPDADF